MTDIKGAAGEAYEGWPNRETWAVALHINNDQRWQESVHEAITTLTDDEGEALIVKASWTPEQIRQAGDAIRENVEDTLAALQDPEWRSMDLINAARDIGSLWRVDWPELGVSFLSDIAGAP